MLSSNPRIADNDGHLKHDNYIEVHVYQTLSEYREICRRYCQNCIVPHIVQFTYIAGESISGECRITGTGEVAHNVNACGMSTTTSVVCRTLVDICNITDHLTKLCRY